MDRAEQDRRIDYVEFPSVDFEATKAFYTQVFGWKFQDWGPTYMSFEDGRMEGGFAKVESMPDGEGGPLVIIYAVDIEAIEQAVTAAGGEISTPTFEFPGGRRFHFTDPVGNVLGVWTHQE
jgi:predicted enzyme related to lactoylglutathione lyase